MATLGRELCCAALLLGLCTVSGLASESTESSGGALMEDGRLKAELEVRDAQAGFAGLSGTITRIEPDGAFTVSRFLNERVEEPHREGRLGREEIESLAEALAEQGFLELRQEIGQAPPVNPRTITVALGERTTTLSLEPGVQLEEAIGAFAARPESPEARLLRIAQTVEELTAGR